MTKRELQDQVENILGMSVAGEEVETILVELQEAGFLVDWGLVEDLLFECF